MKRNVGLIAGTAALASLYATLVRPVVKGWGSTDDEKIANYPGDELYPDGTTSTMHALTIDAPAKAVWAYIMQIGQDRAGYYSYDWLERLVGADIHNTYRIIPKWQHREVGDTYWMAPEAKYGGGAKMIVAQMDTYRSLVLVTPDDYERMQKNEALKTGSWAFFLEPLGPQQTRLIIRSRGAGPKTLWSFASGELFNVVHFIMERKMMLTIKKLAEGQPAKAS
jgi:hypothetical protein